MKHHLTSIVLLTVMTLSSMFISCQKKEDPQSNNSEVVADKARWLHAGSEPGDYLMGENSNMAHSGKKAAYIRCINPKAAGFGTYMQMVLPGQYLGKKVKMTGWMKTDSLKDWAGMWFRVDGANAMLDFDNMQTSNRAIKGTTDWTKYDITLDVNPKAEGIAYGFLVTGVGTAYLDDVSFDIVGEADTNMSPIYNNKIYYHLQPENLGFEE